MLSLVKGIRIKTGNLTTPSGEPYRGFVVSVGGITDPASIERTYNDIDKIFKSNPGTYKIKEERVDGKFHSYSVSTSGWKD